MNPFDCACGHGVTKHNQKTWPNYIPRCSECDCGAYRPNYKAAK